ncbi:RNA-binding S4 domain-containing protein [Limnohabitans sp.]|jgi:ribosome-associated heat shock protein Hsp15|uniref:RNA-binding S4 domain-containing protein n=1 Tax=Limnohabitans sp. TaxID=1907725 RepID=UPI00286F51E8|nr:RNA-binding S4 domain-containing protein [Limnohabitans sp.]
MDSLRIDKWLWAARFYKTRSLACDEVTKHRVQINGQDVKPAREVKVGDTLTVRQGNITKTIVVKGISAARGPAPVAQLLYEETPESMALRAKQAEQNRMAAEPAHSIEHGRPTKRDRRQIEHTWNERWSASADN